MTTAVNHFFGDKERTFRLTPKLIPELERVANAGIGTLCKRLFAGDFSHADIRETIRLALIGGGADPKDAATLVAVYADDAPLSQVYPLAVAILEALWFGSNATKEALAPETQEGASNV
ncbi:gene transfer agent family protein [Methylocystis sp. S23]